MAPVGRRRSDGLGLTRLGLGGIVLLGIVALAAVNTGNNGLYLVLAGMVGILAAASLVGALNVRGLEVTVQPKDEAWAGRVAILGLEVRSRRRRLSHRLLRLEIEAGDLEPRATSARPARAVVGSLGPGAAYRSELGIRMARRGAYRLRRLRVRSLHPFGLFRKGLALPVDVEVLVYPALNPRGGEHPIQQGRAGEDPTRQAGWGHELLGLRTFRVGDDPRDIHWKQTARTRGLIVKERETERSRRLQIVLDNAMAGPSDSRSSDRFESLVSEAATAAVDHLEQGHQVALRTREVDLVFAAGAVQRRRILETLATVGPAIGAAGELAAPDPGLPQLRLVADARTEAA